MAIAGACDWPISLSGQRFRWIVTMLALVLLWRRRWWRSVPFSHPLDMPTVPWAAAGLRLCVTAVAFVKVPAVLAGLAFDRGILRHVESQVDVNPFEQVVVTCHMPASICGANEYRVARRFSAGPVGIEVPVASIHAKYEPNVSWEAEGVVVSWYRERVVVTVP